MTEFPGLGPLTWDERSWWFESEPVPVPVLGKPCRFVLNGYVDDGAREDFHRAVHAFLALDADVLHGPRWHGVWPRPEILVQRGEGHVAVVLECEDDRDPEHGLQVVFRDGVEIVDIGPYGH